MVDCVICRCLVYWYYSVTSADFCILTIVVLYMLFVFYVLLCGSCASCVVYFFFFFKDTETTEIYTSDTLFPYTTLFRSSEELKQLEDEIARLESLGNADADMLVRLREERDRLERRRRLISYIDPIDLRYRRYEHHPKPIAQAVMFCLMDVSGSMSEHMKDLAKRFYALLHLFLTRCYRHVEVVFIRHTDRAEEVDEQTFFYSRETGGTLVSSALEKMLEVVKDRYNPEDWNIYVAQASDGDNMASDNPRTVSLMQDAIIPMSQYVAYLEVGREEDPFAGGMLATGSDLWRAYETVGDFDGRFVMRKVHHRREIYPVFRELFQRRGIGVTGR